MLLPVKLFLLLPVFCACKDTLEKVKLVTSAFIFFQDVSSKIMSFSQHGPRGICILSANGAISNVTLRQAATSGGTVTYEVCAVLLFVSFVSLVNTL